MPCVFFFFFFQAEDGIRDFHATGVQTCALPILLALHGALTPCSAVALRIPSAQPPAISCVPYQSQFVFLCALCCSAQISPLTGSLVRSFLAQLHLGLAIRSGTRLSQG